MPLITSALTRGARYALSLVHAMPCPSPPPFAPPPPPSYFNLSASPLLRAWEHAAERATDAELDAAVRAGVAKLHALYMKLTHSSVPWGVGELPLPSLAFDFEDVKLGVVRLQLANLSLHHVDSLYAPRFAVHAEEPQLLTASIALGNSTDRPLRMTTTLHINLDGKWHALQVDASVSGTRLSLAPVLRFNTALFDSLSLADLAQPLCVLRPLESVTLAPEHTGVALDASHQPYLDLQLWADTEDGRGRKAHRHLSALPALFPNVSAALLQAFDDIELTPLLHQPHHECDIARGIFPPHSPPLPPPAPVPIGPFGIYTPFVWGILGIGGLIVVIGVAVIVRLGCAAAARGGRRTADHVNETIAVGSRSLALDGCSHGSTLTEHSVGWAGQLDGRPALLQALDGRHSGASAEGIGGEPSSPRADPLQTSLARHGSPSARYAITCWLCLNVCLFAYANISVGATVHVLLWLGGQRVDVPSVFNFALVNSVSEFWQSGSYPLAIIIAFFSGVWTHLKLLLIGVVYWTPPSTFSLRRRGVLLRALDASGKWSLVDTQMLILLMVALHFDLLLPSDDPNAPPLLNAKVQTTPEVGVNAFVIATLSSIILAHVVLGLHRSKLRFDEQLRTRLDMREMAHPTPGAPGARVAPTEPPSALGGGGGAELPAESWPKAGLVLGGRIRVRAARYSSIGRFGIPGVSVGPREGARSDTLQLGRPLPWLARLLVPAALLCSLVLLAAALNVTCFTLTVRGLVGAALGPEGAASSYSILTLALEIGNVSSLASPAVLVCLQAIFFLTVAACPLTWVLLLMAIWMLPLRPRALRAMLVAAETVYAWAMADVFVVIVAASLLELDKVAKWTLGDECNTLNRLLKDEPPLGRLLPGEASCFGVATTLDRGFWLFTAAVILNTFAGGFVTVTAHAALTEHTDRLRRLKLATGRDDMARASAASEGGRLTSESSSARLTVPLVD